MAAPMRYTLSRILLRPSVDLQRPTHSCCCRHSLGNKSFSTGQNATQQQQKPKRFRKFFIRSLATVGGITVVYLGYKQVFGKKSNEEKVLARNWQITLYRKMPLKAMSRAWGKFNQMELPVMLRKPLLGLYVWLFGCKLEEAQDEELRNYRNLGEFFRRTLKPHVRNVSDEHSVTSPADGRILHFGEVANGILEQVKGVTYSLQGFLGPLSWLDQPDDVVKLQEQEYYNKMKIRPGNKLYHCVIYLAPGDYHRFHSATNWTIQYRRHFPGELLSVNPGVARWIQGLFNFNERVVYTGEWEHGFFSYTAVGATNVGSIKIYNDQDLNTNTGHKDHKSGAYFDRDFRKEDGDFLSFKGEMFGEFNLGSTIVLIFEAPENFTFCVDNEQKVKFGEPLGTSGY